MADSSSAAVAAAPPTGALAQQRKRKRLNAVLDKITNHCIKTNTDAAATNGNHNNNHSDDEKLASGKPSNMFGRSEHPDDSSSADRIDSESAGGNSKTSNAAQRRELWRETQQQSVEDHREIAKSFLFAPRNPSLGKNSDGVFKFDSFERAAADLPSTGSYLEPGDAAEEVFSPLSGRSPHSSLSSPQVSVDSPRICFSPLRIKDSIDEEEPTATRHVIHTLPKLSVRSCDSEDPPVGGQLHPPGGDMGPRGHGWLDAPHPGHYASLSRPISPNPSTPISPTTPLHQLRHLPAYLTEIYRRRCLSDTDLSASWEDLSSNVGKHKPVHEKRGESPQSYRLLLPPKGGSLESEASSSITQESPLDLSVRSSVSSTTGLNKSVIGGSASSIDSIPAGPKHLLGLGGRTSAVGVGRSRSSTARLASSASEQSRYPDRYSLDRLDVSPVVETVAGGQNDVAYICPICGQMFALHDRLAKHMASRHKSRSTDSGSKAYMCDVCKRSFARSDMLTRHMRLHTGVKPYTCRVCGQVFSRSDHLSTHQRTHTGEKPYRCPSCPYAACRRDMITRHMRTHARYELQESTSIEEGGSAGTESPVPGSGPVTSRSVSSESADLPPLPIWQQENKTGNKPPSPMDTQEAAGQNKKE